MKKLAIGSVALAACLVAGVIIYFQTSERDSPSVKNTTNANPNWHMTFLKSRITSIQPDGKSVRITGQVFHTMKSETHSVPVGYKIEFPDDHGFRVYTIAAIESDGIRIEYESEFDHRWSGRKLIERDKGEFKLP
jgi:hypothetical protein